VLSYRSLHKTLERWELTVLWLLVAAFIVAVALMFLHATAALFMVWVGLLIILVAFGVIKLLRRAERAAARRALASAHCPSCGAGVHREAGAWRCEQCGAGFTTSGAEQIPVS
jgi:hypothetical protein